MQVFHPKMWCAAAIAVMAASAVAQAQDYPSKPVTFITPAAAGNSPDVVGRIIADRLSQMWKRRPGCCSVPPIAAVRRI